MRQRLAVAVWMAGVRQRRGYGDLAQAALDVLGEASESMTPAQVRDVLGGDLAYTTVMTVLVRLCDQGLLSRKRIGRAYEYTLVRDPAQITARRMHRLLAVDADRAGVLARFVDGLTGEDEQVLRDLLGQIIATPEPRSDQS
ncbi:BlaI/MecI/CopY family transcriptional regulator [Micromonospora soli]|uniref:BlaI/MecI/CopY family transcriptional regulator n=1 Tax=Micromonospora sp. NBRC 110009 TaxID=3061627 RepID=UPI002671881B|nr:BlaI/MecI/CopY family transcriptional regulator [Micromonospora sp. NBRC 110009]WKT99986.1 BlaI/MecI/CopY family transcriptional regulator [Micromonospora sp. NBRC 110009]